MNLFKKLWQYLFPTKMKFFLRGQLPMTHRDDYDLAIETLELLYQQALTGQVPIPLKGICFNWYQLLLIAGMGPVALDVSHDTICMAGADWPTSKHYGKRMGYFVPHTDLYGLWEGPNLQRRLDLIIFTLQGLKRMRRKLPKRA